MCEGRARILLFPTLCNKLQGTTNVSGVQNNTRNVTARHNSDPLQTTLLGKLLQLGWLVPSLVLILSLNCLFLVAILRTKKLWRPRFVLPASLCVLDIVQGSLFIPSSAVNIVMGGNSSPAWFCWTQASYFYVGSCCTLSTLTLMAWDRYQAVCNALHYQEQVDLPRLFAKITVAWTFAFAQSLFYIIGIYIWTDNLNIDAPFCTLAELSAQGIAEKRYYIIFIVCELTCVLVICLTYGKVYVETKGYQRRRQQFASHRGRNKRTERTISAQITVLFVFLILRYIQIGICLLDSEDRRLPVLIVKRAAQFLYLTVPCFSNPVIYGLGSKELQTAVRKICCGKPDVGSPQTRRRDVEMSRSRSALQDFASQCAGSLRSSNPFIYGLGSKELQTAVRRVCCGKPDVGSPLTRGRDVEMSRSRSAQQDFASQCAGSVHTAEIQPPSFIQLSAMERDTCKSVTVFQKMKEFRATKKTDDLKERATSRLKTLRLYKN
ncbi:OR14A16 [Branchiostoma lanceolatum]|uniref:OR14A16 protein n=1 Tax=Branchiostoma lanceolatum TaxID=7740 RepID=A0A8K0EL72_BRALA|nr:OR14A16 [Branchiostoma lanceolatum]